LHTRRLATLNALTTSIARVGQNGPMTAIALKELKDLMGADAAWFRLMQEHRLVIFQQIGLSAEFLRERTAIPANDPAERPSEQRPAIVLEKEQFGEMALPAFQREELQQIVVAAVPGKKSLVGSLILGGRRSKSYSSDELNFLVTCAQQLGLALENLHLVEEILRSHR